MAQQFRVVYRESDKKIISLLEASINAADHQSRCADGVRVAPEILTWDDDDYLVMLHDVQVNDAGVASKSQE